MLNTSFTIQCSQHNVSRGILYFLFSRYSQSFFYFCFLFLFCWLEKLFMIIIFCCFNINIIFYTYFNFTTKQIVVSSHSLFNRQTYKIIIIINKLKTCFYISIVLFAHSLVMFVMLYVCGVHSFKIALSVIVGSCFSLCLVLDTIMAFKK